MKNRQHYSHAQVKKECSPSLMIQQLKIINMAEETKPTNEKGNARLVFITYLAQILHSLNQIKCSIMLQGKTALNMEEAATLTGYSKDHLYKLVCQNKIPHYKNDGGKYTYFNKAELESWLLAYRVNTQAEAEQAALAEMQGKKGGRK